MSIFMTILVVICGFVGFGAVAGGINRRYRNDNLWAYPCDILSLFNRVCHYIGVNS